MVQECRSGNDCIRTLRNRRKQLIVRNLDCHAAASAYPLFLMGSTAVVQAEHGIATAFTEDGNRQSENRSRPVGIFLRVSFSFDLLCFGKIRLPNNSGIGFASKIAFIFYDAFQPSLIPAGHAGHILYIAFIQAIGNLQQRLPVQIGGEDFSDRSAFRRVQGNPPVFHLIAEGNISYFHDFCSLLSEVFREGKPSGKTEAQGGSTDNRDAFHNLPEQFLVKGGCWCVFGKDAAQRFQRLDDFIILILH